jgi:hypothetical protein
MQRSFALALVLLVLSVSPHAALAQAPRAERAFADVLAPAPAPVQSRALVLSPSAAARVAPPALLRSEGQRAPIILDDGDETPDDFFGFSDGSPYFWANRFELEDAGYRLESFDFYMRTVEATENIVYVAVVDAEGTTLAEGVIDDYQLAPNGGWFNAAPENPISFGAGEAFFLVVGTPEGGIPFPAGIDADVLEAQATPVAYEAAEQGGTLQLITEDFQRSAFLIRAQGSVGANTPPAISHTPLAGPVPAGDPQTITATITDDGSIAGATLRYSVGGSGSTTDVPMTSTGGTTFEATIPGSGVTPHGLLYQIVAQDSDGASTVTPASGFFSARVRVAAGLDRSIATSGTSAAAYRLVSVPLDLDNKSPAAVLADDLDTYEPEEWRFFSLRADQDYAEFPAGMMRPGEAFWLAVSEAGEGFNTGAGTSVSLAQPYEIPLNAGWTFVATPFNFDVQRAFVRLSSGGTPDVRAYSGSWNTYGGPFRPFEGYAVASQGGDMLRIFPNFEPAAARGQRIAAGGAKTSGEQNSVDWAVRIVAEAGTARDADNLAAVAAEAAEGFDALDRPEPPAIGDYVRVAFPHGDWDSVFSLYSTDARPAPAQASTSWTFAVETNVETAVWLRFEDLDAVPAAYDVWLADGLTGAWQDLRASDSYRLAGVSASTPRTMRLVVGAPDAVQARRDQEQALPRKFEVESYPNPFVSVATVRYGLAEASPVRLTVYDLLGKRVATLVEKEEQEAGYHTAVWEPHGLASGVYVYVLETSARRLTGKLSLVR